MSDARDALLAAADRLERWNASTQFAQDGLGDDMRTVIAAARAQAEGGTVPTEQYAAQAAHSGRRGMGCAKGGTS